MIHNRLSKLLFLLVLLAVSVQGLAQTKTFTMEDAVLNRALVPANLRQLSFIEGTSDFAYIETKDKTDRLMRGSTKGKTKEILSVNTLADALKKAGAENTDKLKSFPMLQWTSGNSFLVTSGGNVYEYKLKEKSARKLASFPQNAENHDFDKLRGQVAYTVENNLYVSRTGAENVAVTNEANKDIVNGQAAHRSEFGIRKGTFWSPQGNLLAFYRMDQSMVTDYPLVDINPLPAAATPIKYPMAGGKSHHVTVGVYNVNTKQTTFLQTGEPAEQYLTNISWSPDEKHIYIAIVNREQNHMKLNQYDASNGNFVKTLFEEKHEKYVEPEHGLYFVPGKKDQFIWFSERSGFDHLYLYDTDGKLIRQLTSGNWMVTDLLGFDKNGRHVFYTATAESPLERHIYKVDIQNGQVSKLSQGTGTHTPQLSSDGGFLLDNFSSTVTPRKIWLLDNIGKVRQTLLTAENPLKDYALGETKIFPIKADDGTDLYCRLILPPNFDPNKKYPAVVYLYGGPHAQMITESWLGGANLWFQHMAQKGYVMFTIDSRGSANRGLAFEQAIFRNLGTVEMKDQLTGVEYLKSQPYIDQSRLGVHGWSYGGFLTTTIMLRSPETFKVGVAGGPVIDWKYYEIMYTERYMDTPEENPEGYKTSSLLNYVPNLKGRLYMIHGTADDVVVWQHSLAFVKKAVDEGVIGLDYYVYPGHKHNVLGKDRVHLMKKITQYFDEHL